ncbi:thioether cross-link-forming SCIFF peptide maturase [Microaerobacter geothermalis]|uniref:thioether cross-link-forming SCIFF peptide maturase n=1 Tax=Microaerobacter geothermalis TaxID=674972 RepID=UPI001F22C747|nr:thioether cross-link-forming SCIFF peptide maturase [Microaerobacter geothermalis]MCF6092834.1 thioether cross-link-forming SCIFF peptide maturase [Microaerobacter geothermalis]
MSAIVHLFKHRGKNIVLDVNSNSLFSVDDLAAEVIHRYPSTDKGELMDSLSKEFGEAAVQEAIHEVEELIKEGVLYTEQSLPTDIRLNHGSISGMCLHVSHDCNLRCRYCFAGTGPYGQKRMMMTVETGKKALDFLIRLSKESPVLEVDFFGGEPLLNFEVIKELVAYGRLKEKETGKKFSFSLTTNGTHLTEEVEQFLNEENINLVLSLDGRPEVNDKMRPQADGSGSFSTILPNLQRLMSNRRGSQDKRYGIGTYTYLRGTFTSENLDFSNDVQFLADMGFSRISMEPVVLPEGRKYSLREEHLSQIKEEYDRLTDLVVERLGTEKEISFHHFEIDLEDGPCYAKRLSGCGAGFHYIAVTPEGDIYPCHQFVGIQEMKMGHLDEGITRGDIGETFQEITVHQKPACRDCWAKYLCCGGCHVMHYNFHNDLTQVNSFYCEMIKKRLEAALYVQVMMQEKQMNEQS